MALTLEGIEIEKSRGYWRSKGFKKPTLLERLEREDGYILKRRKLWNLYDTESNKVTATADTLWGLLKKIC
ncbi:hypothetical protein [Serratia quinivorans]